MSVYAQSFYCLLPIAKHYQILLFFFLRYKWCTINCTYWKYSLGPAGGVGVSVLAPTALTAQFESWTWTLEHHTGCAHVPQIPRGNWRRRACDIAIPHPLGGAISHLIFLFVSGQGIQIIIPTLSPVPRNHQSATCLYGVIYWDILCKLTIWYISLCVWLPSLSIVLSRFMCIVTCIGTLFLLMAQWYIVSIH